MLPSKYYKVFLIKKEVLSRTCDSSVFSTTAHQLMIYPILHGLVLKRSLNIKLKADAKLDTNLGTILFKEHQNFLHRLILK